MKKFVVLLMAALCGAVSLCAADNAVANGDFAKLNKKEIAAPWFITEKAIPPVFVAKTAEAPSFVRFAIPENHTGKNAFCIRQDITKNVTAKAKYVLSFKARGVDFVAEKKNVNIVVIREGWNQSTGIYKFQPTAEWKTFKNTITMVDFKKNAFVVIYGTIAKGTLEITDVTLTPAE